MRPLARPARLAARLVAGLTLALAVVAGNTGAPSLALGEPARQELRLHLALSSRPHGTQAEREALRDLEYELAARLAAAQAGELEGDTWPDGWCVVRIAAGDALRALAVLREPLAAYHPRPGSYAAVRRAGLPEERIPLDPQ